MLNRAKKNYLDGFSVMTYISIYIYLTYLFIVQKCPFDFCY